MDEKNPENEKNPPHGSKPASDSRQVFFHGEDDDFLPSILYIEDNYSHILLVRRILELLPAARFLSANSAAEGMNVALAESPDLILLDIRMPEMDGFELKVRLQEHPLTRHIPVIALSASAMTHEVEKAREYGFKRYITKPINIRVFLDAVNEELSAVFSNRQAHP